jgi:hypothetical protein
MKPHAITGLLVSQIAYEKSGSKRLVWRGPADSRPPALAFRICSATHGSEVSYPFESWGSCWNQEWWVGDFSSFRQPGNFFAEIGEGETALRSDPILIKSDGLFDLTWRAVSIDQAKRRQWLIESRSGWFDAGTHWQEANSHAVFTLGLCDLLQHRAVHLSADDQAYLEHQIINGANYLGSLQEMASRQGLGNGALVHQGFKFDHVVLLADVAKAAAAWARAAEVLPHSHEVLRETFRHRARRALGWLRDPLPCPSAPFNHRAYGIEPTQNLTSPSGNLPTPELLMMLEAEVALSSTEVSPAAIDLARLLQTRQFSGPATTDQPAGLFRRHDSTTLSTKAWSHGATDMGEPLSSDYGNTGGFYLLPLCRLLDRSPDHPEASRWRDTLSSFAYGFLLPACQQNPFRLSPYGHFGVEGALCFAGLWHGCNAVYGQAAALGFDLARLLQDDDFRLLAEANLQWIAGLNSGMTTAAADSCILASPEVQADTAMPVSMIYGIGNRTAGSWMNIRGSICNGFSTGEQFKWDVPPTRENDAPVTFSDEDWITHAGAWLMGIARSAPSP